MLSSTPSKTQPEVAHNGTSSRHRPRHHQLCRRRPRGRRAHRHPQRRRRPHHPVGRRLRQGRRGPGRRGRQAPGRHQRRPHDPFGEAPHGHQLDRRHRRQEVHPAGDQRPRADEAEARRRGLPGRAGHQRRHHRPGLLRRRRAPGHQGGRRDRRPGGRPDHQRAHRRRAGLRPRQGPPRADHPGLRPRRRHLRRLPAGDRRRRLRGEGHQGRQPPRWRRLGPAGRRLAGHAVQEQERHRPEQGQDGPPAPPGGRRARQDRAVQRPGDLDQPALHHRRRRRPAAPGREAHPRRVPADDPGPARPLPRAVQRGHLGRATPPSARSTT